MGVILEPTSEGPELSIKQSKACRIFIAMPGV